MSSRFAPNMVDIEHPLSGIAPVATEIGEQEAIAKFLMHPSKETFLQGAYANSPPMVKGMLENNFKEFQGNQRQDGSKVFMNPNDIRAQKAMVVRTPEQQMYRNLGLRELNEARTVDLQKINNNEQSRVQTAIEGLVDKMFYAATQTKDQQDVRRLGAKILNLQPDARTLDAAITKKISESSTTPEERTKMKADIIQNLMKIKRLQDAAAH